MGDSLRVGDGAIRPFDLYRHVFGIVVLFFKKVKHIFTNILRKRCFVWIVKVESFEIRAGVHRVRIVYDRSGGPRIHQLRHAKKTCNT